MTASLVQTFKHLQLAKVRNWNVSMSNFTMNNILSFLTHFPNSVIVTKRIIGNGYSDSIVPSGRNG